MTLHTAPLDLEQFGTVKEHDKEIKLDVWAYWHEHGYPIEHIKEAYSVVHEKPGEPNTSHIVLHVQTLSKPLEEADVAVDGTAIYCCDCGRYQYHESVDLENESVTDWGECHHIAAVKE